MQKQIMTTYYHASVLMRYALNYGLLTSNQEFSLRSVRCVSSFVIASFNSPIHHYGSQQLYTIARAYGI